MATYYDSASLVMIPSGYKDDKLYSIKPTDGSGDFTFSRDGAGASPATRVNASGLIEKGRENLILQSNAFTTSPWAISVASITGGQPDKDGGNTAWLLSKTGTAYGGIYQTNTLTAGVWNISLYMKAGTNNKGSIRLSTGGSNDIRRQVNLTTGAIATASASTANPIAESATDVGGGWWRFSFCGLMATSTITINVYAGDTADTTGNIYIQDAQLEQGLVATDYIETTTAPVSAGLLGDMPRLDYSGGATCPSLLLEPSRVNLFPYSEYFGADWILPNATITSNAATSPEGVNNASLYTATNVANSMTDVITAANGTYTLSVFVKRIATDEFRMNFSDGVTGEIRYVFNLLDETSTLTKSGGTISDFSADFENYGNGWYRLHITATTNSGTAITSYFEADNQTGSYYIYGAQLESGSYPTSYIPTYGSASTRGKDFGSLNLTSITSGLTEGTLYVEFEKTYSGENTDVLRMQGSSITSRAYIYNNGFGFAADWAKSFTYTIGENTKAVWRLNSLSEGDVFFEGAKGTTGSGTAWSDIRYLYFNNQGGAYLKIKQVVLFPTALTDAECIALTTI